MPLCVCWLTGLLAYCYGAFVIAFLFMMNNIEFVLFCIYYSNNKALHIHLYFDAVIVFFTAGCEGFQFKLALLYWHEF